MDVVKSILNYAHVEKNCMANITYPLSSHCSDKGWDTWKMTEILYVQSSKVSFLLGISSFLPIVIIFFLCGLASAPSPRRIPALVLLVLLIVNTLLNRFFKRVCNQPRPKHPTDRYSVGKGFPSDHAQFMSFFVTYLTRRGHSVGESAAEDKGQEEKGKHSSSNKRRRSTPGPLHIVFYLLITAVVCVSRVYNGHHNVGQVLAGLAVGVLLGTAGATPRVQRGMRRVVVVVIVPVMLWCTSWTAYVV